MKRSIVLLWCFYRCVAAQEASSGFELRATLSQSAIYSDLLAERPRAGSHIAGGFRTVFYPTWKLSRNWTVSGAFQVHSRPYFGEQFTTQGYGVKGDLLQAHVSYSKFWKDRALVVRLGQLPSAFGSFLLRYDDAGNPLIDMPVTYGYYYKAVTSQGLAGAQVDFTIKKFDARAQFVNSSPTNRRSVFDRDQYGNWAGGIGYTIVQGLRVGGSAYYGPYLHRQYAYFFPGEANPKDLPASGYGIDAQWGRGAWNAYGEMQWFRKSYRVIPTFTQQAGYIELRRVLHPRWYVAGRAGYLHTNKTPGTNVYETAAGFRPNNRQLIKAGYQLSRSPASHGMTANAFVVQLVTVFRPVSVSRD